jgi:TonB family protein
MKNLILTAIFLFPALCFAIPCTCEIIFFDRGQSELNASALNVVKNINPYSNNGKIWIFGYADSDGSDETNAELSKKRAENTAAHFTNFTTEILYYGESEPVNANSNNAEKALNRRVEICYEVDKKSIKNPDVSPIQTFSINPKKDTTVVGAKGTFIQINKDIFKNVSSENIEIKLIEAYDLPDMIFSRLSTETTTGELLETAGMVYLDAFAGNKQAELKENMSFGLSFRDIANEGYALYYGDSIDDAIKWKLDVAKETVEEIFTIVETPAQFLGGMSALYEFIGSQLHYPSEARLNNIQGRVYVQFVVDENGKVEETVVVRGISKECDDEVIRVMNLVPNFIPAKQKGRNVKQRMVIPIIFSLNGKTKSITNLLHGSNVPTMDSITRLSYTNQIVLEQNILGDFQAISPAWANIDKPWGKFSPQIIRIRANPDTHVSIVFKKRNSVLQGIIYSKGHYEFVVPKNEAITVIAWKSKNGLIELGIEKTNSSVLTMRKIEMEKMTRDKAVESIANSR